MKAQVKRGPHDPPEPFVVYYDDQGVIDAAIAKYGEEAVGDNPDLRPQELANFETLTAARQFAKKVMAATIYQRVNIHEDTPRDYPGWAHTYDWDEEVIE